MFETAYANFTGLSNVPQVYDGKTHIANYLSAPNWGLGAWGADLTSGTESQRAKFIEDCAISLNTTDYPRLKAQVYFDTYDQNTGTGSIIQDGQKAAYHDLNGIGLFTNSECQEDHLVV